MFDTLQALMKLVSDFKLLDKDTSKMCVGLQSNHAQNRHLNGYLVLRGLALGI